MDFKMFRSIINLLIIFRISTSNNYHHESKQFNVSNSLVLLEKIFIFSNIYTILPFIFNKRDQSNAVCKTIIVKRFNSNEVCQTKLNKRSSIKQRNQMCKQSKHLDQAKENKFQDVNSTNEVCQTKFKKISWSNQVIQTTLFQHYPIWQTKFAK